MLGHISTELSDLDLGLEFPLEAGEEDLALARLEAVAQAGNRSRAVSDRELDQLLIHEVPVAQVLL